MQKNVLENIEKCNGCHACASACPKSCITMERDENGFLYPHIDEQACSQCGICESICPVQNTSVGLSHESRICAYAAIHKDGDIRNKSSSGGAFTAIATEIIKRDGVVFGATFDANFNVVHQYVEKIDNLQKLRGSKYVQSTIGDAYKQVKTFLEIDKWVLFTGTPCQIGGLRAYLKKDYERLITQDIICHGVPSPMVWEKYVEYRKRTVNGAKPTRISFREKNEGWKQFSLSFSFDNNAGYSNTLYNDPMMKAFLRNLSLRESCYNCAYKTKARQSDVTLADFWGIENLHPEMDDDLGVSLVIVHTDKGAKLLKNIGNDLTLKQVNVDDAIVYNSAMIRSVDKPPQRDSFLLTVKNNGFSIAEKRYLQEKFLTKCKKILLKIKNKMLRRKK